MNNHGSVEKTLHDNRSPLGINCINLAKNIFSFHMLFLPRTLCDRGNLQNLGIFHVSISPIFMVDVFVGSWWLRLSFMVVIFVMG